MYVKNFLFVSYSYLSQRDDALCVWPPLVPPDGYGADAAVSAPGHRVGHHGDHQSGSSTDPPAGGGKSCHDRSNGMPERVAGQD